MAPSGEEFSLSHVIHILFAYFKPQAWLIWILQALSVELGEPLKILPVPNYFAAQELLLQVLILSENCCVEKKLSEPEMFI